ncbi:MAG: hypothetical protein V1859_01030 [archaeon]
MTITSAPQYERRIQLNPFAQNIDTVDSSQIIGYYQLLYNGPQAQYIAVTNERIFTLALLDQMNNSNTLLRKLWNVFALPANLYYSFIDERENPTQFTLENVLGGIAHISKKHDKRYDDGGLIDYLVKQMGETVYANSSFYDKVVNLASGIALLLFSDAPHISAPQNNLQVQPANSGCLAPFNAFLYRQLQNSLMRIDEKAEYCTQQFQQKLVTESDLVANCVIY